METTLSKVLVDLVNVTIEVILKSLLLPFQMCLAIPEIRGMLFVTIGNGIFAIFLRQLGLSKKSIGFIFMVIELVSFFVTYFV